MIPSLSPVTSGASLPLPELVALCARHGFRGVEISASGVQSLGLEAARDLFTTNGVAPVSLGLPVEWRKDEDTFRADLEKLPAQAALVAGLGVTRSHTWVLPDGGLPLNEYVETSLRRFTEIGRVYADHGLRLGLEFLGPQQFRNNPDNVWFYDIAGGLQVADEVNERLGSTTFGLLVDCWHWYAGGGTIMDLAACPVEQIVHVHINDAPQGVALPDLVDNVRELPGATGEIDVTGFLTTIEALGYDGGVAVETFSAALNALPADESARQASEAVQKVFRQAGVKPVA
jgi:sugar phosphate isomerase/epimerase